MFSLFSTLLIVIMLLLLVGQYENISKRPTIFYNFSPFWFLDTSAGHRKTLVRRVKRMIIMIAVLIF